eukprot:XP_011455811.1 PREDICTED: uncharacterized protein LOC105348181 [Crassostrea gigas]
MAALSNASLYVLLNVLLVIPTTVGGIPIRSSLYEDHDYLSLPNNADPPCSCSPNNDQRRNETEDNYQPMQDDRRRLMADPPSIPDIEVLYSDIDIYNEVCKIISLVIHASYEGGKH